MAGLAANRQSLKLTDDQKEELLDTFKSVSTLSLVLVDTLNSLPDTIICHE